MYSILENKIFEKRLSKHEIAESLGIGYNTLLAKLKGKQPMKLDESFKIRDTFFPGTPIDYLFTKDQAS